MPTHFFTMKKVARTSLSQVVANYLDIEHILYHSGTTLRRIELISESERAGCFILVNKFGPISLTTFNYYEYRPPHQFFQVAHIPFLTLRHLSTIVEREKGEVEVTVEVWLDLPLFLLPFKKIIEGFLRLQDRRIHEEDRNILERRYRLVGEDISDYLRPWQPLLFKKVFAETFGRKEGSGVSSL